MFLGFVAVALRTRHLLLLDFEMASNMVTLTMKESGVPHAQVHTISATELALPGRESLSKFAAPWNFKHAFGDMFNQLPEFPGT